MLFIMSPGYVQLLINTYKNTTKQIIKSIVDLAQFRLTYDPYGF